VPLAEALSLGARSEGRLDRLIVTDNFRPAAGFSGRDAGPAGYLRFADESSSFLDDEPCRFQVALQGAFGLQFAALAHSNIALNLAKNRNRFRFDLAPNIGVLSDRQNSFRINFAFDLTIDKKLFLKFDRAFDLDVAREDVFARMFSHKFLVIGYWCSLLLAVGGSIGLIRARSQRSFSDRRHRLLRDEFLQHALLLSPSGVLSTDSHREIPSFSPIIHDCRDPEEFRSSVLRGKNKEPWRLSGCTP
jgi:hypothetical protein